jgi:hypothetical protein
MDEVVVLVAWQAWKGGERRKRLLARRKCGNRSGVTRGEHEPRGDGRKAGRPEGGCASHGPNSGCKKRAGVAYSFDADCVAGQTARGTAGWLFLLFWSCFSLFSCKSGLLFASESVWSSYQSSFCVIIFKYYVSQGAFAVSPMLNFVNQGTCARVSLNSLAPPTNQQPTRRSGNERHRKILRNLHVKRRRLGFAHDHSCTPHGSSVLFCKPRMRGAKLMTQLPV